MLSYHLRSSATAPPAYVDSLYGSIPGAQFLGDSYLVPCDTRVNATFIFGTSEFPVHPIDMTVPNYVDANGTVVCLGTFVYTPDNANVGEWFFGRTVIL